MQRRRQAITRAVASGLAGLLVVTAAACSGDGGEPTKDNNAADAAIDAGPADAGDHTAGATDAGKQPDAGADTGSQADIGADAGTDAATADAGAPDAGPKCPGAAGCACNADSECDGAPCLPVAANPADSKGVCASPCASIDGCEGAAACAKVESHPGSYFCVDRDVILCRPCKQASDCAFPGNAYPACVLHAGGGFEGAFCGRSCTADGDCPSGYVCAQDALTTKGTTASQCVPKDAGLCGCNQAAVNSGATTTCYAKGLPGCVAERKCVVTGGKPTLAPCAPVKPTKETCDGQDEDCDGTVDGAGLCEDGNPCTEDQCAGKPGCKHAPDSASPCDDGDKCTTKDSCKAGKCTATALNCDDGNSCTKDACAMASGCTHTSDDGAACDDANKCTVDDKCGAAPCKGSAADCDDKNACTADSCLPSNGCHHAFTADACDDGDACTQGDQCVTGLCAGVTKTCDDNLDNPCLADTCDMATGCTSTADDSAGCDDGNPCLLGESCKAGKCGGGKPRDCDDGNPCTNDLCLKKGPKDSACDHVPNAALCDDGNACTDKDRCISGKCRGATVSCEDANACTDDACDMATGCTHTNNDEKCDDDNACTTSDGCAVGLCAGATVTCNDNDPCTTDACAPKKGCTHTAIAGCGKASEPDPPPTGEGEGGGPPAPDDRPSAQAD